MRTYKHDWWVCSTCGTARRQRRATYPVARILPRSLVGGVAPTGLMTMLYPVEDVIDDERRRYDLYADLSASELSDLPAEKGWAAQIGLLTGRLAEHGVDFRDRDVLDVSGGPGFVTRHLAQNGARRAVVTEFSPVAVEGMRRNLSIDAVKFDYQTDVLRDVVTGTFDVVLIDYSINFCIDLKAFVGSLGAVLNPGGHVYVSWVHPTLGCFLRWQFDEYTYNVLFPDEVGDSAFADAGFKTVAQMADPPYDFMMGRSPRARLVQEPFSALYRARAPRDVNRSLQQRSSVRLFRWPAQG